MANTIYSEDIFLDATINAFTKQLAPLKAFSTDFNINPSKAGIDVSVGLVSAPAAGAVFAGDYETGDNTITEKTVTLKHYFKSFHIGMIDANKAGVATIKNLAEVNAAALANSVFTEVLGVALPANYTGTGYTGTAAAFDIASVKDLRGSLDAAGVPKEGRSLVMDSSFETNLIPITSETLNTEAVIEGRVNRLMGFDVYSSNHIPANGKLVKGMALHRSAIAVASRIPIDLGKDKNAYTVYEVVEIPSLGMSVVYKEWFSTKTGSLWGAYEVLVGSAVGIAGGGLIIKTAT